MLGYLSHSNGHKRKTKKNYLTTQDELQNKVITYKPDRNYAGKDFAPIAAKQPELLQWPPRYFLLYTTFNQVPHRYKNNTPNVIHHARDTTQNARSWQHNRPTNKTDNMRLKSKNQKKYQK